MNYQDKYLKYKKKYLDLKDEIEGGEICFSDKCKKMQTLNKIIDEYVKKGDITKEQSKEIKKKDDDVSKRSNRLMKKKKKKMKILIN